MTEHSKGPWRWELEEYNIERLRASDGYEVICGKVDQRGVGYVHCSQEDSELIAAAPELLEALEGLLDLRDGSMSHWYATAEALIKRVRG